MKKAFLVLSVVAASLTSHALVVQWWQEMLDLSPKVIEAYHGEKITFNVGLRNGGAYVNPQSYTVTFYWQTSGMGEQWWSKSGRVFAFDNPWAIGAKSTDKAVIADFDPATDDPGEEVLNCFFRVEGYGEQHYRVHFTIRMNDSPGVTPNYIEVPRRVLDFNTTTITNAPYYTKSVVDQMFASVNGTVSTALNMKYYVRTSDYQFGGSWGNDREWRFGESLGTSEAKVLHLRSNQKIRVSANGYPMEYYAPNYHAFYAGTASPHSGGFQSILWPDGTTVQTEARTKNLIKAATNALAQSFASIASQSAGSVDESAIIAATNALATATAAKIAAATNGVAGGLRGVTDLAVYEPTWDLSAFEAINSGLEYYIVTNNDNSTATVYARSLATGNNAVAWLLKTSVAPSVGGAGGSVSQEEFWTVETTAAGVWEPLANAEIHKTRIAANGDKLAKKSEANVASVNGATGAVVLDAYDILGTKSDPSNGTVGEAMEMLGTMVQGKADASTVYTKTESNAAFYPKQSGDAWAAFWDGDEVRVTVTNYYGQSDLPHLYLEQRTNETGTAKYKTVWDEHTRWRKFVGGDFNWNAWGGFHGFKTNATARLDELEANKADRAWGFYDSSTGDYAPANYTSVSSSNLMIAAGLAYQRTVTTSGCAVWVLTATEPTTINGTTNGAFQVKDADGNVQVEIVKGDKRTVGARCGGVSVSGAALVANYAVASAEHPTLEVCTDLATAAWKAEDAADCPATVSWSGSSGAWTATVTPSAGATAVFVKASYQVGGDTIFKSNVPVKFSQIIIGTTKYNIGTATVSGSTVLTLTPTL